MSRSLKSQWAEPCVHIHSQQQAGRRAAHGGPKGAQGGWLSSGRGQASAPKGTRHLTGTGTEPQPLLPAELWLHKPKHSEVLAGLITQLLASNGRGRRCGCLSS